MVWTAPMTFADSTVLAAADLNTHVRDNMALTMPAKATGELQHFITTGANLLEARQIAQAYIEAPDATTSASFVTLGTGPSITVTTGGSALIIWSVYIENDTVDTSNIAGFAISGASTLAASDPQSIICPMLLANKGKQLGASHMQTGLTPGVNTFTMQARVNAGTGKFSRRSLVVIAL